MYGSARVVVNKCTSNVLRPRYHDDISAKHLGKHSPRQSVKEEPDLVCLSSQRDPSWQMAVTHAGHDTHEALRSRLYCAQRNWPL